MPCTSIDLRSDTVTLPTQAMYEAMASAELGDDGLDGDPTARLLEGETADLLGKAAGLYVPSATMANLLAVLTQAQRQETVLMESRSHLYRAERGAATLTGSFFEGIPGQRGAMQLDLLAEAMAPSRGKLRPALVCMETSHNDAGGAALALSHMQAVQELARGHGIAVHLDGARVFNAAVALGVAPAALAGTADTVAVCLSKGLSAPMGAVLVGPAAVIEQARALRKMLGGSQRQVGIAAAAGRVAIHTMVARLADDHARAKELSEALQGAAAPLGLGVSRPETNIVQVDVSASGHGSEAWAAALQRHGVRVRPWGRALLRCVTHRHIDAVHIAPTVDAFRAAFSALTQDRA
jgi:threonine aldolase